jgi:aminoglycoside/choline kinase family phosphotransferase
MSELLDWCVRQDVVGKVLNQSGNPDLQQVAGDASFRRYFRLVTGSHSWIVMDAPPAHEDCRPFLDVAERLRSASIHAPLVYAQDLQHGWLLLEDLGDELYRGLIESGRVKKCFAEAFAALKKMALDVNSGGLPVYDERLLQQELDLFLHWYVGHHQQRCLTEQEMGLWQALCTVLVSSARQQPQVFVHRDFHSCNLLATATNSPGVIDFQDAVLGPISYDLASLLWDRYNSWPREQLEQWMEEFRLQVAPATDPEVWQRWCDYMGLQRNLKMDVVARYDELTPYHRLLEQTLCEP